MNRLTLFIIMVITPWGLGHENGFNVDVLCDERRIGVRIGFDVPFRGIVFSKGFYKESQCRFISPNSSAKVQTFDISVGKCGTHFEEFNETVKISNSVIVQHDPLVQTSSDSEVALTCELHNDVKRLTSSISKVEGNVHRSSGSIEAWLDLKTEQNKEENVFYVGDKVVAAIYIIDGKRRSNVIIRNCVAQSVQEPSTAIQLIDHFGCAVSPNLLTSFNVSSATPSMNADIVAVAKMNAFRFTDSDDLSLKCGIEICEERCLPSCEILPRDWPTKRSVNGDNIDGRQHLMQLTMNMLSSTLKSRQPLLNEPHSNAYKKLLNETSLGTGFRSNRNSGQEAASKFPGPKLQTTSIEMTVERNFTVFSPTSKTNFAGSASFSRAQNICFPKIRMILMSTLLGLIVVCLLAACASMAVYIKNEKKRNKLNRYMLYSYK